MVDQPEATERARGATGQSPRAAPRLEDLPRGRALIVPLDGPHDVLSWAIVNGGRGRTDHVVWRHVEPGELGLKVDARALMEDALVRVGQTQAVGVRTARDVRRYEECVVDCAGIRARVVATVGLGNDLAVGDPPTSKVAAGTINILCQVSVALSEAALVEACSLVAEARTAAMLEAALPSPLTGRLATGTGTDCIVIAAPVAPHAQEHFAGKHTACGSAIGQAARVAVSRGIAQWLKENPWRAR